MPFIDVIEPEQAEGTLKEIYDNLVQSRGKIAEVHKIQSLNPESIVRHMDLYMAIMFGKSPLKRYQREMIAVVVSAANNCEYCAIHHGAALEHFWKDEERVVRLVNDYHTADLDANDTLLANYAHALTTQPTSINRDEFIEPLKNAGFDDRAILDAALVTSYFNFVNRMILGLGVNVEPDGGKGYNYD